MRNKELLLMLCLVMYLTGHAQKLTRTYYDYKHLHVHEEFYTSADGTKSGAYTEYTMGGLILQQGTYKSDKMVGKWVMKSDKGVLKLSLNFDNNNKLDGQVLIYSFDGHVHYQESYSHGLKTGTWKTWYTSDDGTNAFNKLKEEATHYKVGEDRDSVVFKDYSLAGKITTAGCMMGSESVGDLTSSDEQDPFNNYNKAGNWKFYSDDGMLVKVTNFADRKYYDMSYYKNSNGYLGVAWSYENDCHYCADYNVFKGYSIQDSITFNKPVVSSDTVWSRINAAIEKRYQKQMQNK
jgi:antitoxin component YwqK of YwqJK toxin-antitoxin module